MNEVVITADSRLEAILRVRSEVGENAAIVSEQRIAATGLPGRLGKKVYQVVASLPARPTPEEVESAEDDAPAIDEMRRELDELREMISELQGRRAVVTAPSAPPQAHRSWGALGVEPEDIGPAAEHAPTAECLRAMLPEGGEIVPSGKPIALIGPPGSGKTTVTAKLAARFRESASVLSLDCYRVGGPTDLRAYCAAFGVPFEAAPSCEDAVSAFERLRAASPTPYPLPSREGAEEPPQTHSDHNTSRWAGVTDGAVAPVEGNPRPGTSIVLIDTPAIQPGEGIRFEELRLALTELGATCHLVLSAAAKPHDVLHAIELASALAPERVVFTQLDLTSDWGAILAAGARWGIPISYVSNGPRVPADLGPASADLLVAELLGRAE